MVSGNLSRTFAAASTKYVRTFLKGYAAEEQDHFGAALIVALLHPSVRDRYSVMNHRDLSRVYPVSLDDQPFCVMTDADDVICRFHAVSFYVVDVAVDVFAVPVELYGVNMVDVGLTARPACANTGKTVIQSWACMTS